MPLTMAIALVYGYYLPTNNCGVKFAPYSRPRERKNANRFSRCTKQQYLRHPPRRPKLAANDPDTYQPDQKTCH